MSEAGRAVESIAVIVVRVGAVDRFAALVAAFAPDGVDVVWDRRLGERRRPEADSSSSAERRRRDRRHLLPASWALLDFLVVPPRSQTP
jgi:hypothetical protein